jgi:single-stranded-DNA-specific exonuclease
MSLRWNILPLPLQNQIDSLATDLGINKVLATLLVQRGLTSYEEARKFFRPEEAKLHSPWLMADMHKAVERLEKAREQQERILVFGDYDVDGTTAVSLVAQCLLILGMDFITYIPDRYKEGYGLSEMGMKHAADSKCSLIIALDCGIKGHREVQIASDLGLDMIICDHHQPGASLPPALAILDPKREDCDYPFKELSGCGVGFKLMQAWFERMARSEEELLPLLDLLAVSIAADIVPIVDENRLLMSRGLALVNSSPRPGIQALLELNRRSEKPLNTEDVVFQIAPKINAAGRIEHGKLAVELLTTPHKQSAKELAEQIQLLNTTRRSYDETITREGLDQLDGTEDQYTSVVYSENWHKGVIGIAASRLIESYYRPTVVLTKSGDKLAGSARSVHGFNLYSAIDACHEHLIQFGGHAFAAGMTMKLEQLEGFQKAFEEVVKSRIKEDQRNPHLNIDMVLEFSDLDKRFYNSIQRMGPFGPGNMTPVFACFNLKSNGEPRKVGSDQKHLKLSLRDNDGVCLDGIAFNLADKTELLKHHSVDVAFTLDLNVWNNKESLQLNVKAIRKSNA